jgi:hypothetical protein
MIFRKLEKIILMGVTKMFSEEIKIMMILNKMTMTTIYNLMEK